MTENLQSLPAPLTPADCNLKNFAYMPLDVERLRDSDLALTENAEVFMAAVLLWCAAWHQVPAASLPDDDRILAQFAGFGRFVKNWAKVRDRALRGFMKCSDGRLYHHVVAEKAIEAWHQKQAQRARTDAARQAKLRRQSQPHPPDATVSVTEPSGAVTGSNGEGRERDRDKNPPLGSPVERGSRLPDDWALDDGLIEYCDEQGYTRHQAEFIAHRFENHWRSATGRTAQKRNWRRAFMNWVTNERRPQIVDGAAAWRPQNNCAAPDWPRRLKLYHDSGAWLDRWGPKPGEPGYLGPPMDDLFPAPPSEVHP